MLTKARRKRRARKRRGDYEVVFDGKILKFPIGNDTNALEQAHRNAKSSSREFARSAFGPRISVLGFPQGTLRLSYPLCQAGRMKLNPLAWLTRDEGETIAMFGGARLVKKLNGKIELLGGSPDDRRAAREWCSLFLHEAVIGCPARGCGSI